MVSDGEGLISGTFADHISIAFYQNEIAAISEIKIDNSLDSDLVDVELLIETEPAFAEPLLVRIDRIAAGSSRHIAPIDLKLDAAFLRQLTEGLRASFVVTASEGSAVVGRLVVETQIYPPSHWGGTGAAPELLAAFVRPNDPVIDTILHQAATKLAEAGLPAAIDGYAAGNRQRSWELASAVWSALAGHGLTYVLPPASFERSGQKVRSPADILGRRTGTCLDLALLYAACLEQAGLNSVLVLTQGHAFVGLWLKKEDFSAVSTDDVQILRKRRDLEDLIFIETTFLTHKPPARFNAAVNQGRAQVEEGAPPLEIAIDVARARARHIKPLDLGERAAAAAPAADGAETVYLGVESGPGFTEEIVLREEPEGPVDRLEKWKRRLLDLSLRNKLLNFKDAKKGIQIECHEPARLEDLLADGNRFKLLPVSDVLSGEDTRDPGLFLKRHGDDGRQSYVAQAMERFELHTTVTEKELDKRLLDLFRVTRTAFEEGGSNVLFLAIGFLNWTQKDKGPVHRAPLLLVPVALQRASVRAGFRLALHDEEVRFNPTLLQMLRQDFKLAIPELEKGLPTDQSGIDVSQVLRIVRTHVKELRGWEVTSVVVLSTFSFTKFLMWRDLVERTELLKRNPIVKHLIDTPKEQYGDGGPLPVAEQMDRDYHPAEIFAPLSADSSQLAAVMSAAAGKDFVLHGPPGTGKSQTIANVISQCLAMGKTVLFVSQKTAALEVVQRRLRDIGLSEYCLEVHSTKAQKSAVVGQLKQAWHGRGAPTSEDWGSAASHLASLRDELNGLVLALHRRHSNGMTAQTAFGRVVAHRAGYQELKFEWPPAEHELQQLAAMRDMAREMKTTIGAVGEIADHPLRGLGAFEWDPYWRSKMERAIKSYLDALSLLQRDGIAFSGALGFKPAADAASLCRLIEFGAILVEPTGTQGQAFLGPAAAAIRRAVADLSDIQRQSANLSKTLVGQYRPALFRQDLPRMLDEWIAATQANFVTRGSKERRVRAQLQPFCTTTMPANVGAELSGLIEIQALEAKAEKLADAFLALPGLWAGLATDLRQIEPMLDWARRLEGALLPISVAFGFAVDDLRDYVIRLRTEYAQHLETDGAITRAFQAATIAWDLMAEARAALDDLADVAVLDGIAMSGTAWIDHSLELASRWLSGLDRAQSWSAWTDIAARADAAGLSMLVAAVEDATLPADEISTAFEVAYARWWADLVVAQDPILRRFLSARHDDAIARFRAADERVAELTKRIVRARLSGDVPGPTAFGSDAEWGSLAHEMQKRAKLQPLRQLFGKIPNVLTRLTPCVMMSPLSIAQYLPPDAKPFDVVIFDEASQIPVWDAIGAIARGNQVVIVGDPEQLPPTSIGERGVDEIEDGSDVEDQESILDEALASNIPSKRLDWHYRSRHESLIAFSNHAYYRGRLVTFPSPVTKDRAVRYVHVPHGVYERGAARVNRAEARAVVEALVRRLRDPMFARERLSIGVVTFNGEQMRLIENLLDQQRRSHPEIEQFFDPLQWHEPVFVKNLENVQGDERDIIYFSVAVGPDQAGRTVSTVSSLNKDGGHRRLNVAITRARQEMTVFATLRPEQVDLSRTAARGVRDFKHFLEFAERGVRAMAEAFTSGAGETESPFEDAVKASLEERGWIVHPQVGVSGFRVDLGIVDPDAPGRYLAGVECDGATYHRSATARDRDRLREHVLRSLGWRIHRVWSTDWWMNADVAAEALHVALLTDWSDAREATAARTLELAALSNPDDLAEVLPIEEDGWAGISDDATGARDASDDHLAISPAEETPDDSSPAVRPLVETMSSASYADIVDPSRQPDSQGAIANAVFEIYRIADLLSAGFVPEPTQFYQPTYRSQLRAMTDHVLSVEAPIYEDILFQRLCRAHGFARAGSGIREAISTAIASIVVISDDDGRRLAWPVHSDVSKISNFRRSDGDERGHADVPICELASLALSFSRQGADRDETVRRMADHFELGRLRSATQARFERAYDRAVGGR